MFGQKNLFHPDQPNLSRVLSSLTVGSQYYESGKIIVINKIVDQQPFEDKWPRLREADSLLFRVSVRK